MNDISTQEKITDTKEKNINELVIMNFLNKIKNPFAVLTVKDVSKDLHIGINQAYDLFKQNDFPAKIIGKRKVVTLASYLLWKMSKRSDV